MTLTPAQLDQAAAQLRQAEQDRRPVEPFSAGYPGLELADAYAIQRANIAHRLASGEVVRGYKVGLTAAATQELLGVDQPDYGHLLDTMMLADGATVAAHRFCQPRIEPEIAFLLGTPLAGPGVTATEVLAATEAVAPSLEIVDSRIVDWRITLPDTIADNASSAAMVLGSWMSLAEAPSLPDVTAELLVNGAVATTGSGRAVLGDPALAVAWLANALAALGIRLEAGHVILPGSCTSAPFIHQGDRVEARFTGLGSVAVTFT